VAKEKKNPAEDNTAFACAGDKNVLTKFYLCTLTSPKHLQNVLCSKTFLQMLYVQDKTKKKRL